MKTASKKTGSKKAAAKKAQVVHLLNAVGTMAMCFAPAEGCTTELKHTTCPECLAVQAELTGEANADAR